MVPAALTTTFMIPDHQATLAGGRAAKILAAIGMFMFFIFCFWGYKDTDT